MGKQYRALHIKDCCSLPAEARCTLSYISLPGIYTATREASLGDTKTLDHVAKARGECLSLRLSFYCFFYWLSYCFICQALRAVFTSFVFNPIRLLGFFFPFF